ncbi:MAG: M23 family metallopeptidase [Candidatus Competibacteraceae bacterium]|nr:M23 family metallopeptidase [Candidatus Competibacteraceae bacterium]
MPLVLYRFPITPVIDEIRFMDSFSWPRGEDGEFTHGATDIIGHRGEPVVSTTGGNVVVQCRLGNRPIAPGVGNSPNGGNYAVIADYAGYFHYYAHLMAFPSVRPGSVILPGTPIGLLGSTGNAGSPHLHYQIWSPFAEGEGAEDYRSSVFRRRFRNPVNPFPELARLARAQFGVSPTAAGRYHIPPGQFRC